MTRPPWEMADVIRRTGSKFLERYRPSLTRAQLKVLAAIVRCRHTGTHDRQFKHFVDFCDPDR